MKALLLLVAGLLQVQAAGPEPPLYRLHADAGPYPPGTPVRATLERRLPAGSWAPPLGPHLLAPLPAVREEVAVELRDGAIAERQRIAVLPLALGLQLWVPAPHPYVDDRGVIGRIRAAEGVSLRVEPSLGRPAPPWTAPGAPPPLRSSPSAFHFLAAVFLLVAAAAASAGLRLGRSAASARRLGSPRPAGPADEAARSVRSWIGASTGRDVGALSTAEIARDADLRDRLGAEAHRKAVEWLDRLDRDRFGGEAPVDLEALRAWLSRVGSQRT